ncbi:MAG TPA: DUF4340 domain-containing protein [Phycisphaerae bacterium]|nr:DUF4340 domain-containing protein [Phycisphaerae bacterium]
MRYTTTLILAVVVLAAVVVIVIYKDELTGEPEPRQETADALTLLEDLPADNLTAVTLEETADDGQARTKMAFVRKDDKWRLSEPVDALADDYEVGQLVRGAVEGKYGQTLAAGKTGQPALKTLGLDPPAYRLTVTGTPKGKDAQKEKAPPKTVVIEIGRKTPVGKGLYVRLADAAKVVVLDSADLLDRARKPLKDYRSRNLVDLLRDDVVRIEVEGPKGALRLDRSDDDDNPRWVLSKPLAARAESEAVADILRKALGIMAADFVEDKAKDLAGYGLAEPRLVLSLYKAGKPAEKPKGEDEKKDEADKKDEAKPEPRPEPVKAAVLKFGASADLKHESVYLTLGDTQAVVTVEAGDFKGLDKGLADLRDKRVVALEKDRATKVGLRVPAKLAETDKDIAYDLAKTDGKWTVTVEGRPDAPADAAAVDDLLKELQDLKVIYFAEGENADAAKGYKALGSVRVQMAKDPAAGGFEIGGTGADVPALVKNIREDWVGRINPKDLKSLRKDWLELLDRQVLALDPKKATRLAIRAPDRTLVFEQKDGKWAMTDPAQAEARAAFAADRIDDLKNLACTKYLAATKDFKTFGLEEGELAVTVTLAPEKDGEKPVEKTLLLAHHKDARIVGRMADGDLVFEVPLALFKDFAGEPLPTELADLTSGDVKRLAVEAGAAKVALVKVDQKWFRADASGRPDTEIDTSMVDGVVRAAAGLSAARWAAYDAKDPARFGLDKPGLRITIEGDKKKATLLVSDKEVDAKVAALLNERPVRYAMTEGGNRIALVAGASVETLVGAAKKLGPETPQPKKEEAVEKKDP